MFFATGGPTSDAALCAELARLVYCRRQATLAFDRERTDLGGAVLVAVRAR